MLGKRWPRDHPKYGFRACQNDIPLCMTTFHTSGIIFLMKKAFIYIGIFAFLVLGTIVAILYGKGYEFGFGNGKPEVTGTGLLVATSTPDGAQVLVDGHLTTATNNTINLAPGSYDVKIEKDGYFTWEKRLTVQKEVVTKAEALLFPKAPKLESITDSGVSNPVIDPSHTKIAYTVSSQSAKLNGIYILNLQDQSLLTLQSGANQIADETTGIAFSKATLTWSPDGQNILATIPQGNGNNTLYLLSTSGMNTNPQDVTVTFQSVKTQWDKQLAEKAQSQLSSLKTTLQQFIKGNMNILAWSPDGTKILYQASTSATMPQIIKPPLIGTNSTPEQRVLQQGAVYAYDIKEDKNYLLVSADKTFGTDYKLTWFPDSSHLIYVHDRRIDLVEYDKTNDTTIYAGPFIDSDVFPWNDGTKVVMLTDFNNSNTQPNLYTIDLK